MKNCKTLWDFSKLFVGFLNRGNKQIQKKTFHQVEKYMWITIHILNCTS